MKTKQSGITLIEMIIVVGVVAILIGIGIPAISTFFNSFESQGGKALMNAALSSARAIAAKEQHYVGISFQGINPQYMTFIIHDFDSETNPYSGFRLVENKQPIKLPKTVGVMDFNLLKTLTHEPNDRDILALTTFSIIFSSSGKLVIHNVQIGTQEKLSRNSFVIYNPIVLKHTHNTKMEYLTKLIPEYINPYIGTIIEK